MRLYFKVAKTFIYVTHSWNVSNIKLSLKSLRWRAMMALSCAAARSPELRPAPPRICDRRLLKD